MERIVVVPLFGFQALCRVSRLSAPHIRNFASEQKLPEGLHPRFYTLKENQKIYQVHAEIEMQFI